MHPIILQDCNLNIYRNQPENLIVTVTATWTWGSRINVEFEWDDGSNFTLYNFSNAARQETASHIYSGQGTFNPSVTIYNYLLDCSRQTLTKNSGGVNWELIIIRPIRGLRLNSSMVVGIRAEQLTIYILLDTGTLVNISVDWNDNTIDSNVYEFVLDGGGSV